jgi:hypothetical protein
LIEITLEQGIDCALDALLSDRLALLCGAGLSMSPPSSLPSAVALAAKAKEYYDSIHGSTRAPLSSDIGEQAEFFFQRGELATVFLRTLVDSHAFAGRPNSGHLAVADLMLSGAVQVTVSTNVDTMIETAGQMLFGQIGVGIERNTVAALPVDLAPLLKVHGCWTIDRANTVWAKGQLTSEPVLSRIAGSEEWLSVKLLDRDLIIVGYFTDWDYLNGVLEATLGAVTPARVIIVNPDATDKLQEKAPALFSLGGRAKISFLHVRAFGDVFLDSLRRRFSESFVRQAISAGAPAYAELAGTPPDPAWLATSITDSEVLWRLRRDLEGCWPNQPAVRRSPAPEPILGLMILQLRARGATEDGMFWLLDGRRVRILRTPNQLLHQVEAAHARETPPIVTADCTIAVGAETVSLPSHLVRGAERSSVARGGSSVWWTRQEAVRELGL